MAALIEASNRISTIEQRLSQLEINTPVSEKTSDVENAVQEYQKIVLSKLKNIRQELVSDEGSNNGSSSIIVDAIKKERDDALIENSLMTKEIEKLNYRIQVRI
jgi:hypothetical protein